MPNRARELIVADPYVLGGRPVFKDTRIPVETLIWHLERGFTIDQFIEDLPSVHREQAVAVLELVGGLFTPERIRKFYEAAA